MPNLLVIGAQKAGSTWLHDRLSFHPDVFMSKTKELRFFGHKDKTDTPEGIREYQSNFVAGQRHRYRGESTPGYFWSYNSASKYNEDLKRSNMDIPQVVQRLLGDHIRLIVSLRNPVARAISAFFHHFRAGRIDHGDTLSSAGHCNGIIDMGFYQQHLEAWLQYFAREQLQVVLFDDIESSPSAVVQELYTFLDLAVVVDDPNLLGRSNQGITRQLDKGIFSKGRISVASVDGLQSPQVTQKDIDFLAETYQSDIDFVERFLDRPMADWRSRKLEDYI